MVGSARLALAVLGAAGSAAGCAPTPWPETGPTWHPPEEPSSAAEPAQPTDPSAHSVEYRVLCSASTECRVSYTDGSGDARSVATISEWTHGFGTNGGLTLRIQVGSGGCPPAPVRVAIVVDGTVVAEELGRADGSSECQWINAATEHDLGR